MVVQPLVAQQAQAQAQAQALQAAVNAGAQANQQRSPFWNMQGMGGGGPMMGGGLNANFYSQMQASALAAQEQNAALVAVAKLGPCKTNPASNSSIVVRNTVRKFNVTGGILSVAQWTRKTVEENLDWLVKLAKRHFPNEGAVLLAYGDGCETLVLIDGHADKLPSDFTKIKKIGIGASMAEAEDKNDESKLASSGILQSSDPIWEHLRFEQLESSKKDKKDKCLFVHTNVSVWSDSVEGRRRVLQVITGAPQNPYHAVTYKPNPAFEQQVLAKWKETYRASASASTGFTQTFVQSTVPEEPPEPETVITFNAKELLLLEKAFDNLMNSRDLKSKADKPTEEDRKKVQLTIRRAQNEFVWVSNAPRKRRKKAAEATAAPSSPAKASKAAQPAAGKTDKPSESAKKTTKEKDKPDPKKKDAEVKKEAEEKKIKKEEPEEKDESEENPEDDSDDEPISKLKPKTPVKRASRASTSAKKAKSPAPEKKQPPKRGRSVKEELAPKKGRSRSRLKK
jgi:hypothetical protein